MSSWDQVNRPTASYRFLLSSAGLWLYVPLTVGGAVAFTQVQADFIPSWKPDARSALEVMWQVHATLIAISFSGLAIAFQLFADPPLATAPARRSIIQYLRFTRLLVFGAVSSAALGATAVWLSSDANVIFAMATFVAPTIITIALAYGYTAKLASNPLLVEQLTVADLLGRITDVAQHIVEARRQNQRFSCKLKEFGLNSRFDLMPSASTRHDVHHLGPRGTVTEVRLDALRGVLRWLSSQISFSQIDSLDGTQSVHLSILVSPRDKVRTNQRIATVLAPSPLTAEQLREAELRVRAAVRVGGPTDSQPDDEFRRELADLQDNLIDAIHGGRYSRAARGFEYYAITLDAAAQTTSTSPSSASGFAGDSTSFGDWSWLAEHQ